MQRFKVSQWDADTFIVTDTHEDREFCVCANYDTHNDAEQRAETITILLNKLVQLHKASSNRLADITNSD